MRDMQHEHSRLTLNQLIRQSEHAWHGVKRNQPDWSPHSHSLGIEACVGGQDLRFYLILNAWREPLSFELPKLTNQSLFWRRWIDTALESPNDIVEWRQSEPVPGDEYRTGSRSVVILIAGSIFSEHTA